MSPLAARGIRSRRSRAVELVGVPYSSTGRLDGIRSGIDALRAEGLADRLVDAVDLTDAGDLGLHKRSPSRGDSGLLNERGLSELIARTAEAVTRSRAAGRRPLLVGGDCPVLLGALRTLRTECGATGLLMLDGHEDAWPPMRSPTGEGSDSELAIALGMIDELPGDLRDVSGVLPSAAAVLIGPRDADELHEHAVHSVASRVGALRTDEEVRERGADAIAREAVERLDANAPVWWLHVDLDVLSSDAFPAADYLQPGGLDWAQLTTLTTSAWASPKCAGASVVIYNAELDPNRRAARRTIDFLAAALPAAAAPRVI